MVTQHRSAQAAVWLDEDEGLATADYLVDLLERIPPELLR